MTRASLGMQSLAGGWRAEQGREALSNPNSCAEAAKRDGARKWSLGCLPFFLCGIWELPTVATFAFPRGVRCVCR